MSYQSFSAIAERRDLRKVRIKDYRVSQFGKVYRWRQNRHCFVFIGNLNDRTLREFIYDYEHCIES